MVNRNTHTEGSWYRVRPGEHLAQIAVHRGWRRWEPIWEHAENADLRERRDPSVLLAGDRLFIPTPERRDHKASAGQKHRFRAKRSVVHLCIHVSDLLDDREEDPPPFDLQINGESIPFTEEDGVIEAEIPATAESAELFLGAHLVRLAVGHIDPVETPSGQAQRLRNLGYLHEESKGDTAETIADVIAWFQFACGELAVDGLCGPLTQARLSEAYGF